jgi:glycerol-3-phosphate acyltransferase PlsY
MLAVLLGYLAGSVPFAFLLARRAGIDVRVAGSGNVGAANVLRTTGVRRGLLVMLLDVAKGAAAIAVAHLSNAGPMTVAAAGGAAIVGHIYPVWLKFRGGKGVAVAAGVFALLAPAGTLIACVIFIAVVMATRYVSLGSVAASLALPPAAWLTGASGSVVATAAAAATLIVFRHRANLGRVRAGTERRLGVPA